MTDPWTDAQVEQVQKGAVELLREIRSGRLERAIRLTKGHSLDPTSTGVFSSGGEVSDPTGNRACAPDRKDPEHALLMSLMETVETAIGDLVKKSRHHQPLTGSDAHAKWKKENSLSQELEACASVLCDNLVPDDHRHCDTCNDWLERHPGMTQVPRDTIAQRLKKRKQREARRIHVTGPLAEEIA